MTKQMSDTDNQALGKKFWERPLSTLNRGEWEALCDGCGRCCLKKFSDEDTEEVAWTRVVCRYFDERTSQCGCYEQRTVKVPDCIDVNHLDIAATHWMPDTCAYRLRALDKPLFDWHPLISGSRDAIEEAQIHIAGKVISEEFVHPDGYEEHVIRWINEDERQP